MTEPNEHRYPYSDDFMTWDALNKRYEITEKALEDMAVLMRANLSSVDTSDPSALIRFAIRRASIMVYSLIHQYNIDTAFQDYLIGTVPSLRPIIQEALSMQAVYNYMNGDLGFSPITSERENRYQPDVPEILGQIVPELGRSILYTGQWRYC